MNRIFASLCVVLFVSAVGRAQEWEPIFNGKDLTGAQLPDGGTYTLKVTATDPTGAAIASTNYVQGVVTGVTQANGATSITVNGGPVDWSKVVSVDQGATTSTATT